MSIRLLLPSGTTAVLIALATAALSHEHGILQRVPELQKVAASGSALGCGWGSIRLVTSQGEITVATGLDPIHVFGTTIQSSDLLMLLRSRIESNRSGKPGPMSGEVSSLCYVCLDVLSHSKDPEVVVVIADLLTDEDDVIRGWAAIALYRISAASESLQRKVGAIRFPQAAIDSARSRGEPPPVWIQRHAERDG